MPLMVGVGNGFEEIFVSPGATHVFGRAGSFTLQAERIPATRLGPQAAHQESPKSSSYSNRNRRPLRG